MKKILLFFSHTIVFLQFLGCSEPFSFETPDTSIDVVDAKVSTEKGRSYVDIYRMDKGNQVPIKDLDVYIISYTGAIYEFSYEEELHSYRSIDPYFTGEVGVKYKMEASSSGSVIYESQYDSIPEVIDFNILLKDTVVSVFFSKTNGVGQRRATSVFAEIPSSNKNFYARFNFRYFADDFWIPGDTLYGGDPLQYTILHKSEDEQNNGYISNVSLGERLIDKYYIFVDPTCSTIDRRLLYTGNALPLVPDPCYLYLEFWPITFEVSAESISEFTFNYWKNVKKLSENDGLIFDTFPFLIESNITCNDCENQVTGLFRTVSESIKRGNL